MRFTISSGCAVQEPVQSKEKTSDIQGISAGGETAHVFVKGFKFVPKEIKIKVGTTIRWMNEDSAGHTIESTDGLFESPLLKQGESWSFTFSQSGTYMYRCGPHASMKGSVIVE